MLDIPGRVFLNGLPVGQVVYALLDRPARRAWFFVDRELAVRAQEKLAEAGVRLVFRSGGLHGGKFVED